VIDRKPAIAIDFAMRAHAWASGFVVERIDIVVEPNAAAPYTKDLTFDAGSGDVPLHAAEEPQSSWRAVLVVEHVVIRGQRRRVDGDRIELAGMRAN